jgi:hypothetical protein
MNNTDTILTAVPIDHVSRWDFIDDTTDEIDDIIEEVVTE